MKDYSKRAVLLGAGCVAGYSFPGDYKCHSRYAYHYTAYDGLVQQSSCI